MMLGLWEWSRSPGSIPVAARQLPGRQCAAVRRSRGQPRQPSLAPLQAVALVARVWWLVVPLWLSVFAFASQPGATSRAIKLLAGASA